MKELIESHTKEDGTVVPEHEIEKVCGNCAHDLNAEELTQNTCASCGTLLEVKQSVSIKVTSVFSSGTVMI